MNTNIKNAALAFCGALALASCKKETVETTTTDQVDGDTVVTTTTTTEVNGIAVESDSLKAKWEKAKQDVKDAVAKGDKKAQEAAQKTADEAEAAWNKVKANVQEDAAATKEKFNDAKEDLKENYNEALEKAKAK